MNEVVIASSVRTAVGKAPRGTLRTTRPDDLAAFAIQGVLERIPQLDRKEVEDVILGCAMPEAEQGMNVARVASFRAGLPIETAATSAAAPLPPIAAAPAPASNGAPPVTAAPGGTNAVSSAPAAVSPGDPTPVVTPAGTVAAGPFAPPVTATVTDAESSPDSLTFEWSADLGTFSGTGLRVTRLNFRSSIAL